MEKNHSGPFGGHFAARGLLKTLTQDGGGMEWLEMYINFAKVV